MVDVLCCCSARPGQIERAMRKPCPHPAKSGNIARLLSDITAINALSLLNNSAQARSMNP